MANEVIKLWEMWLKMCLMFQVKFFEETLGYGKSSNRGKPGDSTIKS